MLARSTWHYTLLHDTMVLKTKAFFAPTCHPRKRIMSEKKLSQSSLIYPRSPHTSLSTSKYNSNANSSQNIPLFPSLGLELGLGLGLKLGLRSNQPLARNSYIPLHATTWVSYYFYSCVLSNYYHTNRDGGVLDNPYSLHVFHNK